MENKKAIPRVIHYCWFGGNPLPELAEKCIASWKKYCPDYEIIEWNESNYDVHACAYIEEAYEAKKWAFVSDFARYDILCRHGGVYFDTDVELVAPLEDLLEKGPFLGVEQSGKNDMVNPGLGMAAPAGLAFYQKVLDAYRTWHFRNPDGNYNQTTVVKYTTDLLKEYGLGNTQQLQCVAGIWIYPWEYFCPMRYETGLLSKTANTRSIHHYSASWLSKEDMACHRFTVKASRMFGEKVGGALGGLYSLPLRFRRKVRQSGFRGAVKTGFQKVFGKKKKE